MRKKITRLVYAGIACFCMVSALAQEQTMDAQPDVSLQQETKLRIGENKWPAVWPDSVIVYRFSGELYFKRELVSSSANNANFNIYDWKNNAWVFSRNDNYTKSEYDFDPYFEEMEGKLYIRVPTIESYMSFPVNNNTNPAHKVERNPNGQITYAEGDAATVNITYNARGQINTILSIQNEPAFTGYYQYQYDENGNFIGLINPWRLFQAALYDSQGRRTREYYFVGLSEYNLYYVYHYPDGNTSLMEPANNNPVGNSNQGSFELTPPISVDSLYKGSFVVQLPDGFTLDENNTSLTIEFSDLFDLKITRQENNCWQFEILPKTLRSVSLRVDEVTKMLKVAYTVDEKVKQGTYSISINSILFETKGGNEIPEPAFTVPAVLSRLGVAVEQIEPAGATLWITDQTLYIQSAKADRIMIYSITGSQLYETAIQPGINAVDAANLPQGILLVKASSGWVTKVVNRK